MGEVIEIEEVAGIREWEDAKEYEAEVENAAYNEVIIPEYMADLDAENR